MRVVRTISDLQGLDLGPVGFVPTMGALHEGHVSLMRLAREVGGSVVVSIFVNPTQFAPDEDFASYPRREEGDIAVAERAGVDVIFAPSTEEVYQSPTTSVVPRGAVASGWEAARRPGHFAGVATVVLKLFNIVRPKTAFFGLKDIQQCAIIKKMVSDLNCGVALRFGPTVRGPDGLALSSRNAYLSNEERRIAPLLHGEICKVASSLLEKRGEDAVSASVANLENAGFTVDYLEIVDVETFLPSRDISKNLRVIAAAWLGRARLIDNEPIGAETFT